MIYVEICRQCEKPKKDLTAGYVNQSDECPAGTVAIQFKQDLEVPVPEHCVFKLEQAVCVKRKK